MSETFLILLLGFVVLLIANVPVAVTIALVTYAAIYASGGDAGFVMALKMVSGIDSFALLAIPLFVISGILMGQGGIASRLIDFAAALMSRFPGGLAYVNTLACMLFGSISGSATAAVSSIGGFMIPEMQRKGYPKNFSVALTITAATTGLIIPPSNIMIIYAVAAGSVSIVSLFLAGILPGILIGVCIMVACFFWARKHGFQGSDQVRVRDIGISFLQALPSLMLMLIVIGGILTGIFTPTEAAAIAVVYSYLLAVWVYREVGHAELPKILSNSCHTTAVVLMLVAASSAMSWLLTIENAAGAVTSVLGSWVDHPVVLLIVINVILLIVGTFMDITPAVLIFTPICLPLVVAQGMDPLHFGIMLISNLCIGLCTPPVGSCLFVGCGVGKTTIAEVTPSLLIFFAAMLVALALITYVPWFSLAIPSLYQGVK